jgi:hypothetical protein
VETEVLRLSATTFAGKAAGTKQLSPNAKSNKIFSALVSIKESLSFAKMI